MAIEKVIDINIQGNADEAVGSLRSQLKQAQAEVATLSEKFGVTSVEAANAAKKAAELKDRIGDAKSLTDAFNPDAKFKALSSSLAGVAGGFAAVQGGMALFGAESEDVQKTLLKVQSAMALSQGLQSIGESIDSFKQLGAVINNTTTYQKLNTLATAAAAAVQKLFTGAVNTTATSFNALKTAIVSTGIGALVVGIGYLIAKMNENADATEKLTLEQESLNKQLEITKKLTDDNAKAIDYDTQIKLANAKKVGASDKELLRIQLDGYEAKGKANNKEIEEIQKTQSKSVNLTKEQNKRIQELREQNLDLQRKGNVEIANSDADLANKQREASKKAEEDSKANKKRNREEIETARKKEIEDKKKFDEETKKGIEDLNKSQAESEKKRQEEAQKIIDDLAKDKETPTQKLEREYEEKKAILEAAGKSTFELEMQHLSDLEDLDAEGKAKKKKSDEENAAAEVELAKKTAAAKQALFAKTSETLSKGADLLGKNTAAGKAMAAAAALINTYQGITAELATKTVTPFEIGLKIANVAIIAATGFKAVQDIVSVQIPGGGGGGGGAQTGSAPSMTAPSFNTVGSSSTNQLAQTIGSQSQTPIKSYVVASDVSTAQALDRNIISNASI